MDNTDNYNFRKYEIIAHLVGYFVSVICRDTEEWEKWGVPFLELSVKALHLRRQVTEDIVKKFAGSVGKANSFIVSVDDEDEWASVITANDYLTSLSEQLVQFDDDDIVLTYLNAISSAIEQGSYDARARTISHHIVSILHIPQEAVRELELQTSGKQTPNIFLSDREAVSKAMNKNVTPFRLWKVGLAAAAGGALMFYTGGSAAPMIVTSVVRLLGISTSMGQLVVNMTSMLTTCAINTLTSLGVGVTSYKMLKRTEPLKQFQFQPLHHPSATISDDTVIINATITKQGVPLYLLVPGQHDNKVEVTRLWGGDQYKEIDDAAATDASVAATAGSSCASPVTADSAPEEPPATTPVSDDALSSSWAMLQQSGNWWRDIVPYGEEYVLEWEPEILANLYYTTNHIFSHMLLHKSLNLIIDELLRHSISSITLPLAILERASELDNPWALAMDRARQAGQLLAAVLLSNTFHAADATSNSAVGRAVTLVGYGIGARVVYHCLETLAAEPGLLGRGIVENAVLVGAPTSNDSSKWQQLRMVVSNRLVNCYNRSDWLLASLYRIHSWDVGVAGLGPISLTTPPSPAVSEATNESDDAVVLAVGSIKETWKNIENVDITTLTQSNCDYALSLPAILSLVFGDKAKQSSGTVIVDAADVEVDQVSVQEDEAKDDGMDIVEAAKDMKIV